MAGRLLSLVLPGAGHAYLRRIGFSAVYVALFLGLVMHGGEMDSLFILALVLYVLSGVHAYAISQIYRRTEMRLAVALLLLVIGLRSLNTIVFPGVYSRLLYDAGPCSGPSMTPTLETGDEVIVNRLIYRVSTPKVGDIIAFVVPESVDYSEYFDGPIAGAMKRIVAVGGDTVFIENGTLFVNGEKRRSYATAGPNFSHLSTHSPSRQVLHAVRQEFPRRGLTGHLPLDQHIDSAIRVASGCCGRTRFAF